MPDVTTDPSGNLASVIEDAADAAALNAHIATQPAHGGDLAGTARPPTAHTHAIAQVVALQAALDGKSAVGHGHAIADIASLQATLDDKALIATLATHAADLTAHGLTGIIARIATLESAQVIAAAPTGVPATDLANLQAAATAAPADGVIQMRLGTYTINGTVTLKAGQLLRGVTRNGTAVVQQSLTQYAFSYTSTLAVGAAIEEDCPKFESFTLIARFGINLNQSGTWATIFDKQAFLLGGHMTDVHIFGDYPSQTDANRDSAVVPTQATVDAFGIGFRAAKCFDFQIGRGCAFASCGVGVRWDGCDISEITGRARFIGNARHLYVFGHDTLGGGFHLKDADMLVNRRAGGVFLDSTPAPRIRDNYFECVTAAGLYLISQNDYNTRYSGNRIADPINGTAVKVLSFAPQFGLKVVDNAFERAGSPGATVELLNTFAVRSPFTKWRDNGDLPTPAALTEQVTQLTAAATLVIPESDSDVFLVNGATTINNITAPVGKRISLLFVNGTTVAHFAGGTGNLRLQGGVNFVAAGGNMLTIVYLGPAYFSVVEEVGRKT